MSLGNLWYWLLVGQRQDTGGIAQEVSVNIGLLAMAIRRVHSLQT